MNPWMTAAWVGAHIALRRLSGKSTLLITLGAIVFATLSAWSERHVNAITAADNALRGPGFGLAIPLATLGLVTVALARTNLEESVGSIALIGGSRRAAAIGLLVATSVVTALVGVVTATVTTIVAHGQWSGVVSDAFTSAWIGGVTGFAYAYFYGFASSFGKHGGGRVLALLGDLILGPLAGTAAVLFPRAHALNLLGAPPVLELPQMVSTVALVAMAAVFAFAATLRTHA